MDMAIGESPTSSPSLQRAETISPDSRVRHIDQLDDDERAAFLARLADGDSIAPPDANEGFSDAEVIVFTDYFRVQFA